MEENGIDFNTELKKKFKDLVVSLYHNDKTIKKTKINDENIESSRTSQNLEKNFSYLNVIKKNSKNTIDKNDKKVVDSNKRLLFTEQTTKSSETNNYIPKTKKSKMYSLKIKENKKNKNNIKKFNLNIYNTFSPSKTYHNFKEMKESTKEKRLYEDKIRLVRKNIEALKKQQIYLKKVTEKEKQIQNNKNKIKIEKESIKQALLSIEIDKRNELDIKRKNIANKKLKEKQYMMISKIKIKNKKIKEYKKAYIEKKKIEEIIYEDNNKTHTSNKLLIDKIKFEREKYRKNLINEKKNFFDKINNSYRLTYRNNLNETKKLKNELMELEKMEEQYLEKMKHTKNVLNKNKFVIFKKYEKMKSFDNINKSQNLLNKTSKRNANSVMKRIKKNNEDNISRNKMSKMNSLPKIKYEINC